MKDTNIQSIWVSCHAGLLFCRMSVSELDLICTFFSLLGGKVTVQETSSPGLVHWSSCTSVESCETSGSRDCDRLEVTGDFLGSGNVAGLESMISSENFDSLESTVKAENALGKVSECIEQILTYNIRLSRCILWHFNTDWHDTW